ncbi:MAG: TRAP transporter small permease subunit [Alphaproteobacteria bacterium]|nr:TRAP transporter small permease subunit [Alphaproteobacteria bacterium]
MTSDAPDAAPAFVGVIEAVDAFTGGFGRLLAWLFIPLVGGLTWEVAARYVFNAPTLWAFDLTYMLYGTIFMLGASYALLKGAHIRTDMLWEKFSDRTKGKIDTLAYVLFFFPAMIMLFSTSIDDAIYSFSINEKSEQTAWRPVIWPFKSVIPLTALLLLIQGTSELLKSVHAWRTGRIYRPTEKIEV